MSKKMDNEELENKIIELRKKGYSRNKISSELHIGHSKVQAIINKHNLSAKKGYDIRKIPKKEKVKKVKVKKEKAKIKKVKEKPKTTKFFKVYGYCRFHGYKGLYYYSSGFGTSWITCYSEKEIPDAIIILRNEIYDRIYHLEKSLTNFSYKINYVKVKKVNGKLVKQKIGGEHI